MSSWWDSSSSVETFNYAMKWFASILTVFSAAAAVLILVSGKRLTSLQHTTTAKIETRVGAVETLGSTLAEKVQDVEKEHRTAHKTVQQKAEQAQKSADDARHQATIARAEVAPRRLTDEQKATLTTALSAYQGQRVDLASYFGVADGTVLAQDFLAMFQRAGWVVDGPNQVAALDLEPVGIEVRVSSGAPVPAAADALLNALKKSGVQARGIQDPTMAPGSLLLLVGPKPQEP